MKNLTIILISFFLIGCFKVYDLTPNHNKDEKTLSLDTYKINNIYYHASGRAVRNTAIYETYEVYKAKNDSCQNLIVANFSIHGSYYFDDTVNGAMLDR